MNLEYKQVEIASIINKKQATVSKKLAGKLPWFIDEIKMLYDVLGDEAWEIYEYSQANRMEFLSKK